MCEIASVTAQAVSETSIVVQGELTGERKALKVDHVVRRAPARAFRRERLLGAQASWLRRR